MAYPMLVGAGMGAVCKLMKLRACLATRDWEGGRQQVLQIVRCPDFQAIHLQVGRQFSNG